jgi:sortase (surface protein transpeptidase)
MKPLLVGVAVVAVLVSACGSREATPPPVSSPVMPSTSTEPPSAEATTALARSVPVRVRIPRIGADSSLTPLSLNADETIQVPPVSTPMQAGWYVNGPTPGETGPAIILGHVDGNKHAGIFHRLREMKAGEEVLVDREDGTVLRFVVSKVDQTPKDRFPTEAVYGDTEGPELRLITCGGAFDRAAHNYLDNIIVYAVLQADTNKDPA